MAADMHDQQTAEAATVADEAQKHLSQLQEGLAFRRSAAQAAQQQADLSFKLRSTHEAAVKLQRDAAAAKADNESAEARVAEVSASFLVLGLRFTSACF